jgi:dihydroorotate dehydrogenase (NAD+) catalytic subunit
LGNQTGGLSGPSIKPITLRLVWETYKAVKTPILGVGGIETVEDVLQYVAAGATAVQVGTASFTDPTVSQRLVKGLERAFFKAKTFTVNEIRGKVFADFG